MSTRGNGLAPDPRKAGELDDAAPIVSRGRNRIARAGDRVRPPRTETNVREKFTVLNTLLFVTANRTRGMCDSSHARAASGQSESDQETDPSRRRRSDGVSRGTRADVRPPEVINF